MKLGTSRDRARNPDQQRMAAAHELHVGAGDALPRRRRAHPGFPDLYRLCVHDGREKHPGKQHGDRSGDCA